MGTLSEFYFETRYIKGKENRVTDALNRRVQMNHVAAMSSYGTYLQDQILKARQQDDRYRELRYRL